MGWFIKDDIPYLAEYPELYKINDTPKSAWVIKDDLPFKLVMAELYKLDDAPSLVWVIKDDLPFKKPVKEISYLGAFCYAENLSLVKIPKSVKKIGPYSFAHTALTEVTIASDCEYYPTSFPKDCVINFYPDILMDNNKNILYTKDGEIIYTKRIN